MVLLNPRDWWKVPPYVKICVDEELPLWLALPHWSEDNSANACEIEFWKELSYPTRPGIGHQEKFSGIDRSPGHLWYELLIKKKELLADRPKKWRSIQLPLSLFEKIHNISSHEKKGKKCLNTSLCPVLRPQILSLNTKQLMSSIGPGKMEAGWWVQSCTCKLVGEFNCAHVYFTLGWRFAPSDFCMY